MVASSAMGYTSSRSRPAEHVGVGLGVDLAAQDLLGAGHRERGDLLAQRSLRALRVLLDLGAGAGHDAVALGFRLGLRFVDDLRGALLGWR